MCICACTTCSTHARLHLFLRLLRLLLKWFWLSTLARFECMGLQLGSRHSMIAVSCFTHRGKLQIHCGSYLLDTNQVECPGHGDGRGHGHAHAHAHGQGHPHGIPWYTMVYSTMVNRGIPWHTMVYHHGIPWYTGS